MFKYFRRRALSHISVSLCSIIIIQYWIPSFSCLIIFECITFSVRSFSKFSIYLITINIYWIFFNRNFQKWVYKINLIEVMQRSENPLLNRELEELGMWLDSKTWSRSPIGVEIVQRDPFPHPTLSDHGNPAVIRASEEVLVDGVGTKFLILTFPIFNYLFPGMFRFFNDHRDGKYSHLMNQGWQRGWHTETGGGRRCGGIISFFCGVQ